MNFIPCKLCRALLLNDWDEKTHMEWHATNGHGGHLEGLVDTLLNGQRVELKYEADENTPYVDNAASVSVD